MQKQKVMEATVLPLPGNEGFCPFCKRPTLFKHHEQFPGDAPFRAYQEPISNGQAPIVQVRKMICSHSDCGKMLVTLDTPKWKGTLVPYEQYS
jgi:hypothetical protein